MDILYSENFNLLLKRQLQKQTFLIEYSVEKVTLKSMTLHLFNARHSFPPALQLSTSATELSRQAKKLSHKLAVLPSMPVYNNTVLAKLPRLTRKLQTLCNNGPWRIGHSRIIIIICLLSSTGQALSLDFVFQ